MWYFLMWLRLRSIDNKLSYQTVPRKVVIPVVKKQPVVQPTASLSDVISENLNNIGHFAQAKPWFCLSLVFIVVCLWIFMLTVI
jgi:hypothetical protein